MGNNRNMTRTARLLLLVTHACSLKCKYCFVNRDNKKFMSRDTLLKSIDFLMTSSAENLQLQFFGGEPLMLPFELIQESILYANKKAKQKKRNLEIIVTTNGVLLNEKKIDFLRKQDVILEVSLDGTALAQNTNRPQLSSSLNSYKLIVKNVPLIHKSGIDCRASMVVTPATVGGIVDNFNHLVKLGFKNIFMMIACCVYWSDRKIITLRKRLAQLEKIYLDLAKEDKGIELLSLREWFNPLRMNTEISVDFDGNIYSACISYLIRDEETKRRFILGHIDSASEGMDEFEKKRLSNVEAMYVIFKENKVMDNMENNIYAGLEMTKFVNSVNYKLNGKTHLHNLSPSEYALIHKQLSIINQKKSVSEGSPFKAQDSLVAP